MIAKSLLTLATDDDARQAGTYCSCIETVLEECEAEELSAARKTKELDLGFRGMERFLYRSKCAENLLHFGNEYVSAIVLGDHKRAYEEE